MKRVSHWFGQFAKWASHYSGHPIAFGLASLLIVAWLLTGPMFSFDNTWQMVINTATTIVTFLMVFVIQNAQNRDTGAMQAKLDELIRAVEGAHNALLDLEELDEEDIETIRKDYRRLAAEARLQLEEGLADTNCAEITRAAKTLDRVANRE